MPTTISSTGPSSTRSPARSPRSTASPTPPNARRRRASGRPSSKANADVGAYWLHDLDDVVAATGLVHRCWNGWETRSRSSGGYDQVWAVFTHHTASSTSPDADCRYMWDASGGDQPIGALYLARDGSVTIGAAGATNCQGKGGPWTLSHGTIPQDKGNTYGIAVEAANNGTGEAWPAAQTDAYVILVAALCDAYGLDPARDVLAHFEWVQPSCPGRKVDPVGPSPYATGAQSWDMNRFRADCVATTPTPPTPPAQAEVTNEDKDDTAERVYKRIWKGMTKAPPTGKDVTYEQLLGYARHSAANADAQTKPKS